jgi:spore maturation protein CgeB
MHFTHRNFEIAITGSLLFSQKCFGLDLYLLDGVDYVSFTDLNDLTNKIKYYLANENLMNNIRLNGQKKAYNYLKSNFVWNHINLSLKYNNLKPLK